MRAYRLTETAERELNGILVFVAERESIDRALHVHSKFVEAFDVLAANPGSGTRRRGLTPDHVRWWPVFSFQVVYDAESRPTDILRVLHGARDLPRLFPGERLQ